MKITYLMPTPSSKGGMSAITKMFYQINFFDNKNYFHFNTSFQSENRVIRFFEFFGKHLKFVVHLVKIKPDVVFVMSNSYLGFYDKCIYCLVARAFGVKSMLNHVGGEFDKFYNKNRLVKEAVNFFIKAPTALLIGSSFWTNYFRTKFPKVKVINSPNPIICSQYEVEYTRNNNNRFVVSSLFRIIKEKGVHELMEVIKKVIPVNDSIDFVIMGGGPMLNYLSEELGTYIKSGRVRVLGFVDDELKIKEICKSDLYMMLTHFDLMPISIMEAMAARLPVISTNVGGIPDLVLNGRTGFLFNVGEISLVAEKVLELAQSKNLSKSLGGNGRIHVKKNFDIYSVVDLHKAIASKI